MTGAELKAWRLQEGLSQKRAAERIGCSRVSIQNWEAERLRVPQWLVNLIEAWANAKAL